MNINPYQSPTTQDDEESQEPIKVKAYGLVLLTRGDYFKVQLLCALVIVAGMLVSRLMIVESSSLAKTFNGYFMFLMVSGLVAVCIDTVHMLVKYKRAHLAREEQVAGQHRDHLGDDDMRSPDESQQPIKVKMYGQVSLSRTTYLTIHIGLTVVVVAVAFVSRPFFAASTGFAKKFDDYFWVIVVGTLVAQCVESAFILSKYKKAYRERSQQENTSSP